MRAFLFFGPVFAVAILAFVGWVLNIVKIFGADFAHITGPLILRVIGVFIFPIGVILGWF